MDLMKYKYIKNTKSLPKFKDGDNGYDKFGKYIDQGFDFLGNMYNVFSGNKSSNDLYKETEEQNSNINGVNAVYKSFDGSAAMKQLSSDNTKNTLNAAASGASLGNSIGGPIGAGIGGLVGLVGGIFGGQSRKNKLRRQINDLKSRLSYENNYNQAQAFDKSIKNNYDNVDAGKLYVANRGFDQGADKVWNQDGYKKGNVNSLVGKGESIVNFNEGKGSIVTKGKRGVDNQPSSVSPNDDTVIFGNDINWVTGNKFSDDVMLYTNELENINKMEKKVGRYGKLSSLSEKTKNVHNKIIKQYKDDIMNSMQTYANQQKMQHDIENYKPVPMFYNGYDGWIPSGLNAISSIGNYISTKNQSIHKPTSYRANPYQGQALNIMRDIRINPYGYIRPIKDVQRQYDYSINNSGGYTGGQKALQRAAVALGTQRNISDMLNSIYDTNNKYKQAYANALLSSGESEAQRKQQAYMYDDDTYAKARGAQTQMLNTYRQDLYNAMWQNYANRNKYNMFKDTLNMYYQDNNPIQKRLEKQKNKYNNISKQADNYIKSSIKDYQYNNWYNGLKNSLNTILKIPTVIN